MKQIIQSLKNGTTKLEELTTYFKNSPFKAMLKAKLKIEITEKIVVCLCLVMLFY